MKLYVASSHHEIYVIREIIAQLIEQGHTITYDWTAPENTSYPHPTPPIAAKRRSVEDLMIGVKKSDIVIVYMKHPRPYQGTWMEMGGALILKKPVWLVGTAGDSCLLTYNPLVVRFANMEQVHGALEYAENHK